MTKTTELRKVIKAQLSTVAGGTYHKKAPNNAVYPYKVFTLKSVDLGDANRDDVVMEIDIWDRSSSDKSIEDIADKIEDIFNGKSYPNAFVLPTFYRDDRKTVDDPDDSMQHIQLTINIQNYYIGG